MNKLSVMVVDDDQLQLAITAKMLSALGVQRILTASDALAALAILEGPEPDPDLVLSDLSMPNTDGIEFLTCLSRHHYPGSIAIVSGMSPVILEAASKLAREYRLKLLGVLAKPLSLAALQQLLIQAAPLES